MPWQEIDLEKLAKKLGVNLCEVSEKHKLIGLIVKARKKQKVSQTELAKKVGVTQGRIAQIESGISTHKITFDVLLNILIALGYEYKIVPHNVA